MEAVFGLLVILLGVSHGVEIHCDGRQDGAKCYGALGGTVVLQLMDSSSEIFKYLWKKTVTIFHGRNDNILRNTIEDRSIFIPSNGTFKINNLIRTDGGEYTLQIFDSKGHETEKRTLQLSFQAPVSSVLLDSECLSQGEMRVSCSSEGGDSPQYSWTLDGHQLTDAQLLSTNKQTNSITLKRDVSGLLVCSVRNHVSYVWKELKISTCATPTMITHTKPSTTVTLYNQTVTNSSRDDPQYISYSLFVFFLRAAVALALFVGIAIYFACKKKKYMKVETSSIPGVKNHPGNSFEMVEL